MTAAKGDGADPLVDFQTDPARYRHWKLSIDGDVATLLLDVDENGALFSDVALKLNSYDLGVDIELADAVQRLRFEHPNVGVVLLRSGKDRVFSAGANIQTLARASHSHKVNFCKFTNETRNAIEDASQFSDQKYICVVTGAAAGGGYELALATDYIILADDGSSALSLPEIPLLAVLPGTGGLTRLADKRGVRRDHADVFCTTEEGIRGKRAVEWRLADEAVPRTRLEEAVSSRVQALASLRAGDEPVGIRLAPLERKVDSDRVTYSSVRVDVDRATRVSTITVKGPEAAPEDAEALVAEGSLGWGVRCARELDDAILHLRFNEREAGVIVFKSEGNIDAMLDYDRVLVANSDQWLAREIRLLWKRVLKRIDLTSRSLVALIEPGSAFAGTLAELAFVADRSYMLRGDDDDGAAAALTLSPANFGWYPMSNGLTRLESRFLGEPESVDRARESVATPLRASTAEQLGLVTFSLDEVDYADEVRVFLEERASFSPDALTGMEANLRWGGPETMESKIFARLTAWQNWIFQRPNAVGPEGALRSYGTGRRPVFDDARV
jgi:benzoyl-CoA-dihydrodiol lyase